MKHLDSDRLNDVVRVVANNFDLKTWRYICHQNVEKIENYFGVLVPLTVFGCINEDPAEEIEINILLKIKPVGVDERMKSVLKYLFETECFLYMTLVPIYRSLCRTNIDALVPNCYYANLQPENEIIVLQDMTFKGYRRYSGQRFLDYDHIVVSLKALAQFHSFSVILFDRESSIPADNDILKPYTDTHPSELNNTLKSALENHSKYFKGSKYENFLRSLKERYADVRVDSSKKAKCLVYGHGDYWKENIMFKYENDTPIQACILDYQTLQTLSASQDFLRFLIVSLDTNIRREHFEEFLSIYLETFNATLSENNVELTSFNDDFKHDMKVVAEDCIITSFMAFALWYGLEEDTFLKSKDTTDKENAVARFTQTIIDVLDDLDKLGLISL